MAVLKRVIRNFVLIGLAVGAYFVVPVGADVGSALLRSVLTIVLLGLLAAGVVWQVVLQVEDPSRRIDGLLLALVVSVLGFALAFYHLAVGQPGEIHGLETRLDAIYFTMTTLLTIGFGDIYASGQTARGLVIVQMIFNVVILALGATTLTSRIRSRAEMHAEARAQARRLAAESGEQPPDDQDRHQSRRTHRNPT